MYQPGRHKLSGRGSAANYAMNPPAGSGFMGPSQVKRSPAAGYGERWPHMVKLIAAEPSCGG